jgi:predicted nucleotidyltransferase
MEITGIRDIPDILIGGRERKAKLAANIIRDELGSNLEKIVLFGSVPKGKQKLKSDIDLGIILTEKGIVDSEAWFKIKERFKKSKLRLGDGREDIHTQIMSHDRFTSMSSTKDVKRDALRGGKEI